MLVRLQSGSFVSDSAFEDAVKKYHESGEVPANLTKRCLLVYEGDFSSMSGPVTVTKKQLENLVEKHNGLLSKLARLSGIKEVEVKNCPPLQLDHSTSARDTIGRVPGNIELGEHTTDDGKKVAAVYGNAKILGKDNVERVLDGRWLNLSTGADFEAGELAELTVTPFPAAKNASFLKQAQLEKADNKASIRNVYTEKYHKETFHIYVDKTTEQFWIASTASAQDEGPFRDITSATKAARDLIDDLEGLPKLSKKLSSDKEKSIEWNYRGAIFYYEEGYVFDEQGDRIGKAPTLEAAKKWVEEQSKQGKLSEGEGMDKEKLKKYLKEVKKMSEDDAEKHLAECDDAKMSALSAEVDEHDKKLAAESDETAEAGKKAKEVEMSKLKAAAKTQLVQLGTDFRKNFDHAKLTAKKGKILTRLSALKASAKVSPAEIKKMDLDAMAKQEDAVTDAVFASFEAREPVIHTGLLGSVKADDLSKLAKTQKMSQLEHETRANMSFKSLQPKTKLGEGQVPGGGDANGTTQQTTPEHVPAKLDNVEQKVQAEAKYNELCALLDGGKVLEAKAMLKQLLMSYEPSTSDNSSVEAGSQLAALAKSVEEMQTNFESLHKLTSSLVESETKE